MPSKVKSIKKTASRSKSKLNLSTSPDFTVAPQEYFPSHKTSLFGNPKFLKIGAVVLVLAAVFGLVAVRNRKWFIVASVNGSPILTSELNGRLSERFGSQMLEALIGEKLIVQEANKQNVVVTDADVTTKMTEIEKSLNGQMTLEQSLKLQGISKSEFVDQLKIQLLIDKMLSKDVSVSAQEVDEYLKTNSASLTATIDAERRIEAERAVKNTKVSSKFLEWFQALKEAAKIERYL